MLRVLLSFLIYLTLAFPAQAADTVYTFGWHDTIRAYLVRDTGDATCERAVFVWHPGASNALAHQSVVGIDAVADAEGFCVIYLEGTGDPLSFPNFKSWNVGECCSYPFDHKMNDGSYSDLVIQLVRKQYPAMAHIFFAGYSNGGGEVTRMLCDFQNGVEGAVIMAGFLAVDRDTCYDSSIPVRVKWIYQTSDPTVPPAGGVGNASAYSFYSVASSETYLEARGVTFLPSGTPHALTGTGHSLASFNTLLSPSSYALEIGYMVMQTGDWD